MPKGFSQNKNYFASSLMEKLGNLLLKVCLSNILEAVAIVKYDQNL
jgi:hypothetical protein